MEALGNCPVCPLPSLSPALLQSVSQSVCRSVTRWGCVNVAAVTAVCVSASRGGEPQSEILSRYQLHHRHTSNKYIYTRQLRPRSHSQCIGLCPNAQRSAQRKKPASKVLRSVLSSRSPIYKIFYDLLQDYRKFIVRSTYDSDLKSAKISFRNIFS